jgi:hypothetical protein
MFTTERILFNANTRKFTNEYGKDANWRWLRTEAIVPTEIVINNGNGKVELDVSMPYACFCNWTKLKFTKANKLLTYFLWRNSPTRA